MIRYYNRDGEPMSDDEFEAIDRDYFHVRATAIDDETHVSTVWLGLHYIEADDGPPLIFETMVFGGPLDQRQWRYPNLAAAEAGHEQAVELARAACVSSP